PEVDAVRAEDERGLDVVVDDERGAQRTEACAARDDLAGRRLHSQLYDRGAGGDGRARRLQVVDDRVHPHSTFALASSVSGASTVSPSETWSTGPVTEATRPSDRAAERATSAASPPASIDSTPRTSAATPTSVATSPTLPRSTVTPTSSRIRFAVSVRYVVAP